MRTRELIMALAAIAAVATAMLLWRAIRHDDLERLGAVGRPPMWLGVPVPEEDTTVDSLFELGMRAYEGERWEAAVRTLERALAAGADPLPTGFFLGVSRLMAGRHGPAADAFATVIARGESPYLIEARYYRAKALLRLKRADQAVVDLEIAAAAGGELGEASQALADSVRATGAVPEDALDQRPRNSPIGASGSM